MFSRMPVCFIKPSSRLPIRFVVSGVNGQFRETKSDRFQQFIEWDMDNTKFTFRRFISTTVVIKNGHVEGACASSHLSTNPAETRQCPACYRKLRNRSSEMDQNKRERRAKIAQTCPRQQRSVRSPGIKAIVISAVDASRQPGVLPTGILSRCMSCRDINMIDADTMIADDLSQIRCTVHDCRAVNSADDRR